MNSRLFVALLLALAASALAQNVARIKVIHAFPLLEAPTVDIFISSDDNIVKTLTAVPFKVSDSHFLEKAPEMLSIIFTRLLATGFTFLTANTALKSRPEPPPSTIKLSLWKTPP